MFYITNKVSTEDVKLSENFKDVFDTFFESTSTKSNFKVYKDDDSLKLVKSVPGFNTDNLSVKIVGTDLKLTGEVKTDVLDTKLNETINLSTYFSLYDINNLSAKLTDGVLVITIKPKKDSVVDVKFS